MMEKESYVCHLPLQNGETDSLIGVVVTLDDKHKQFHCGLAFQLDGDYKILHLAHHNALTCDKDCSEFKVFVIPNIPRELQIPFIQMCRAIKEEVDEGHNDVAYGLNYDEYASYVDGKLYLAGNEIGLTCATYVITLFHSAGINLVDIHNWPEREEDKKWFDYVKRLFSIQKVKMFLGMTKEHQEKVLNEKFGPRFRPEEVAVSSALYENSEHRPAATTLIWEHGARLNQYMKAMF